MMNECPYTKKANSINTAYYMYVYMYDVVSSFSSKFLDHTIFTPDAFDTEISNTRICQKKKQQ